MTYYNPGEDRDESYPKPQKKADGRIETVSEFLERVAVELYGLPASTRRGGKTWQERQLERPFEERLDRIFKGESPREPGEEG